MKTIVAFGEIMGRISPPGFRRLTQAMPGTLDIEFAGAEANVVSSIALLGGKASFITALPDHELGDACIASLRGRGVGTEHIVRTPGGRLGLYFLEKGANQRSGKVIYDREGSSVSLTNGSAYDWDTLLRDAGWLHLTGITSAISAIAAQANLVAAKAARDRGIPVSCDLNYRSKLWRWKPSKTPNELAVEQMHELLPWVTHLMGGREDAAEMLGIRPRTPPRSDEAPDVDAFVDISRQLHARFPQLQVVSMTQRQSLSATNHFWGGFLYSPQSGQTWVSPKNGEGKYAPYAITHIVDRVGGGDAFSAGLIFAWNTPGLDAPQIALDFATAASCLAHSVEGDTNWVTRTEVESLMAGAVSGRVRR